MNLLNELRRHRMSALALAVLIGSLMLANCGGGGGGSSATAASTTTGTGSGGSGSTGTGSTGTGSTGSGSTGTGSTGGSGSTGSGSTGSSGGSSTALAIHVSGNHFVDGNGNTVQLRGVNVSGLESVAIDGWDPANPWGAQTGTDTPNWTTIKTWGGAGTDVINAVRLPLNEASWLGLSCVDVGGNAGAAGATIKADPGGNYQATVTQSVADATAAGLYVILDLHWAAPGNVCPTIQNAMADSDHSIAFWTSLATAFKGNPAVIFELFNEPFINNVSLTPDSPWSVLENGGGTLTQFLYSGGSGEKNLTWTTAGMQQMLNAVRATGATNVVLTSTLQWAQAMDGWLQSKPTDPAGQLGAAWHPYPADGYPTQVACVDTGAANSAGNLPGCSAKIMADVQAVLAAGYPVVATEYGDSIGGSTAPWASKLLPWADTNGVSYLGWTWDTWSGFSADVLITDANGTPTQGYGTYVKQHYTCVAAGTANCP